MFCFYSGMLHQVFVHHWVCLVAKDYVLIFLGTSYFVVGVLF